MVEQPVQGVVDLGEGRRRCICWRREFQIDRWGQVDGQFLAKQQATLAQVKLEILGQFLVWQADLYGAAVCRNRGVRQPNDPST
jgi:hypothetical protein